MLWLILGGSAALAVVVLAYSYVIWKNDPDRLKSNGRSAQGGTK